MTSRRFIAKHSLVGLSLTVILLAGCAAGTMVAYEGPALPKERIAVIKSAVSGFVGGMAATAAPAISCIDGREVTGEEIHVLPGRRQIQISLFHQPSSRNFRGNLEFEAQANHEYIANGAVVGGQPLIWVEDKNTTQRIILGVATDQSFKRIQCQ
jgi:hypothetical protein